ncbi:T cell receptor beta chain MC.7.G5-like [Pristis pectinata]|uniref:T cell receptor beta chain MC.7.G5-like n=1 Tax=Pristis pectinata TaxID=685728 RepID=UPI00223E5295|nr:T cell receptor beta chain MC.7.G5-like [Pristis pectinata]
MIRAECRLAFLLILVPGILATYVEVSPSYLSIGAGEKTQLTCTLSNTGYPFMSWYRQRSNGALELLFTSAAQGSVSNYTSDSYTARRPSNTLFSLELNKPSPSQSAVYFCSCKDTGLREAYFGTGTKLVVLEHDVQAPTVTLLRPSRREVAEKKRATVVCLITRFYPENIEIQWVLNDEKLQAKDPRVQSDPEPVSEDGNKTFSITTRLQLEAYEWAMSANVMCNVLHYQKGEEAKSYQDKIDVREVPCGISNEQKMLSMGTGILTYLVLICKSILYAVIASVLAMKAKTSHSKRFD